VKFLCTFSWQTGRTTGKLGEQMDKLAKPGEPLGKVAEQLDELGEKFVAGVDCIE
jgi:hypothetical protein